MRIDEFDEFQGLTPQMVREWLGRHGWVTVCWVPDDFNVDTVGGRERIRFMSDALITIARKENRSIQSLLREINPRMRKGMPSDAALAEHDEWIVCTPFGATFIAEISYGGSDDGFSIMMPPINDHCDAEFIAEKHWPECLFWPCDEHGNKVRWPTDAEGKML